MKRKKNWKFIGIFYFLNRSKGKEGKNWLLGYNSWVRAEGPICYGGEGGRVGIVGLGDRVSYLDKWFWQDKGQLRHNV